jgi:hypothetical protein
VCVEENFLITEMGVLNEAKNVTPLKFLLKIIFSPLVNSGTYGRLRFAIVTARKKTSLPCWDIVVKPK